MVTVMENIKGKRRKVFYEMGCKFCGLRNMVTNPQRCNKQKCSKCGILLKQRVS